LAPAMIAVTCGGAGNRLREVRICFAKDGAFRACGENENQWRLCAAQRMYVPPVRAPSPRQGDAQRHSDGALTLPGPRDDRD